MENSISRLRLLACIGLLQTAFVSLAHAGDAVRGQQLYEARCGGCHSLDANRVGPAHRGVFGRKAGAIADYNYSPAVKNSGVMWNEKTLDQWLSNPQQFIPGQKMGYSVPDAIDRSDLIAYLRGLAPH